MCERERKRDLCETEIQRYSVPVVRPWCWDGLRSCWPCSSVRVLWARLRLRLRLRYQLFETMFMTIVYDQTNLCAALSRVCFMRCIQSCTSCMLYALHSIVYSLTHSCRIQRAPLANLTNTWREYWCQVTHWLLDLGMVSRL